MKKIGIFYGPEGGSTARIANMLSEKIGSDKADLVLVKHAEIADLNKFDNIIFGISTIGKDTWDMDHSNNDWDIFFPKLDEANLEGKKIAMYGLGDSVQYAANFVDALGVLYEKLQTKNSEIVGMVSPEDYSFEESKALVGDKFVGLPIDEDFEEEKTDERIENWLKEIKTMFL